MVWFLFVFESGESSEFRNTLHNMGLFVELFLAFQFGFVIPIFAWICFALENKGLPYFYFFFFSFLNVTIQDCSDTRWRVMEETDEFRIDGDCIKNWGRCWTRWKISQLFLFFFNVCFGNNIIDFWIRNWFLSSMQLF